MNSARFFWHKWLLLRSCRSGGLVVRRRGRSSETIPTCPRRYPSRFHWTCHCSRACAANHLGLTSNHPSKVRRKRQRPRSCHFFFDFRLCHLRDRNPFEPPYERRQVEFVASWSVAVCGCGTATRGDGAPDVLTSSHPSSATVSTVACTAHWSRCGRYLAIRSSSASAPQELSVLAGVSSNCRKITRNDAGLL